MQQIHPVTRDTCKPYIGQRVCAVLHDGTQVFGVISSVTDKGIEFNGAAKGAEVLSRDPKKAKQQLQKINQKSKSKVNAKGNSKAATSAYGPYGYGAPYGPGYGAYGGYGYPYGGAYALDWAAIALLFLIPFLFI